jgi:salicylate hydroxylase
MIGSHIAIVGGGPAGLTAAIACGKLGLDVTVYEQTNIPQRVSGGVLLHSNGQRVLHALGLLTSFEEHMCRTPLLIAERPGGKRIGTFHYSRLNIPFNTGAVVMRHSLQEHLLDAAIRAGAQMQFGHRCVGLSETPDGVRLKFQDGREVTHRVVVACDGVHSAVRPSVDIPVHKVNLQEAWVRGVAEI